MKELTENQKKVYEAIKAENNTIDKLVETTGLSKSKITGTITSLLKGDAIRKSDDGSYAVSDLLLSTNHPSSEETVTEVTSNNDRLSLVIPYLKSEASGEELKFALRSIEKHLKTDVTVVIVGDKEDWFSPEIVHIPHEPYLIKEDCDCPAPSMVKNPQADVTHKLFTAIASGVVTGNFILSNDDIFLLGPTLLSDIEVLKAFGTLDKGDKVGGTYNQNAKRTANALEKNNLPIHRYGTHTPMFLNAEELIEVIEKYNALDKGYLLTSLYFNEKYPDARPLQVDGTAKDPILGSAYRSDIPKDVLEIAFKTRKFLNCDSKGWTAVKPFLELAFPHPSNYEH
ncbi:hypothetical protein [Sphingobacterium sp.]|uniref:hypothetical protein n=1 Tax=Sphingobacterium sp. TaxID=341027 RepID=UPI0028990B2B|nr:hypothetical protein [Sphingobacterium sp.]